MKYQGGWCQWVVLIGVGKQNTWGINFTPKESCWLDGDTSTIDYRLFDVGLNNSMQFKLGGVDTPSRYRTALIIMET